MRQTLAEAQTPEKSSWAIAAGTTQAPAQSVVTYRGSDPAAGARGQSGHVLSDIIDVAAGPDSTYPIRLSDLDGAPASGYMLMGSGPPGTASPRPPAEDVMRAALAPGIRGAVRIMPDVNALPKLGGFLDGLPPWLRYRVVLDLRLIPEGARLPFRPEAFATQHFVQVDVPHQTAPTWVQPTPAPGENEGGYGYLVGWNGQRTTEQFASSFRWTPTPIHVPSPSTRFGPAPPSRKLFDPVPIPPNNLDLASFGVTKPAEVETFERPLGSGWVGTSLGGGRTWVHPPELTTVPEVVSNHTAVPGETKFFIGGVGIATPEGVWADLGRMIDYVPPDVAGRFEFQPLGTGLPPVVLNHDDHSIGPSLLPPEGDVVAKVAGLASEIFPDPTIDKVDKALNDLATFAWGRQIEGMPQPGVRLGPPSLAHRIGEFDYINWEVVLRSPTAAQISTWQPADWTKFGALAGHELVHADQFALVVRFLAVEHNTKPKLAQVFPTKQTDLINGALNHPLTPGTAEYDHGKALYDSLIGDVGLAQRQAMDARMATIKAKYQQLDDERMYARYFDPLDTSKYARLGLESAEQREAYTRENDKYRRTLHELSAFGLEHLIQTGPAAVTPEPVEASVLDMTPTDGPSGSPMAGAVAGHPVELEQPRGAPPAIDPIFEDLLSRVTRVGRWHDLLAPLVRDAAAARGSAGPAIAAWASFGEQLTRTLRAVDLAAQGRPTAQDAHAAYENLLLAYGLAFDSLLGRSIGWDFLPTTAELTGRAPVVAKPAGVAGTWLTWRLRMALGGLSRAGDPGVTAIADQWQAIVAQHRESLTPDALDTMLAFVEDVRARQAPVGEGPGVDVRPNTTASSPTSSPAESVVRAWLAQDAWTTSAGYFGEHAATLVGPESAATLRQLLAANPDDAKLRLHGALLELARQGLDGKAFDYLTRDNQNERKQIMIDMARSTTNPAAFHAIGQLPYGVDVRAGKVSFSELAYGKMMTSINWFLDGNAASAVELATDARRHLSGRARIDFLKILGGLGSEVSPAIGPGTAATAPSTQAQLQTLKLAIVDC